MLKRDPHAGDLYVFRGRAGRLPIFCIRLRFATIAYRWHPLAGRSVQVSPFRRGKDLLCIYTDERPDLSRELPTWMFGAAYCSPMTLGPPEISIEGLDSFSPVGAAISPLPDDVVALKALLAVTIQRADEAEARLATAAARESATQAMIAHLKLQIAKLRREQYGPSAERSARLLEQMELQLEDLEADAGEDDVAAEAAAAKAASVAAFERKRPVRKPFPRASAARARRHHRAVLVPGLWRHAPVEAGRGRDRDARGDLAGKEGHPDRPREGRLP